LNVELNKPAAAAVMLKAATTWATNTIAEPKRIARVHTTVSLRGESAAYLAPANSIQVLEIDRE